MMTSQALDRRDAVVALLKDRGSLLVISGLGSPSFDVHHAGDTDANYYLWGAMGAAALMGLGLAQARPDHNVLVITGDGEQLMGLGGLATIAIARPKNLTIAVVDNGHFGETGMQKSHTGLGLDLARIGAACGFVESLLIEDLAGVEAVRARLHQAADGPRLYVIKVKAENLPRSLPPRDAIHLKNRFRSHLGLPVT
jgi:thiamine pyrophosphate-dependent acetolactate synthase large subunit-like protein